MRLFSPINYLNSILYASPNCDGRMKVRVLQQFLIQKHNTMNTTKFSEEAKEYLIGRQIIAVGDNYIVLDNGCRIYLDDSEIDSLN